MISSIITLGDIVCSQRLIFEQENLHGIIKNKLICGKSDLVMEKTQINDFCILPDGNLLLACNSSLKIYDKNLKLLKIVDQLNNEEIVSACYVTTISVYIKS